MLLRVAIIQLDFHPSYSDITIGNLDGEPFIYSGSDDTTLFTLINKSKIQEIRNIIRETLLEDLKVKINVCLNFLKEKKVDLVVFPEYSLPIELLPICREKAISNQMLIIAGSHTCKADSTSISIYKQLGFEKELSIDFEKRASDIRASICPIFIPDGSQFLIRKKAKSPWEGQMIINNLKNYEITVNIRDKIIKLYIYLCIDALSTINFDKLKKDHIKPKLVIIPANTPKVEDFHNVCSLLLKNEIPSIFVNNAITGGSKIFSIVGGSYASDFLDRSGSISLPPGEAIIIADLNLLDQAKVKESVNFHCPIKIKSIAPIMYKSTVICHSYKKFLTELDNKNPSSSEFKETISNFLKNYDKILPEFLRHKIMKLATPEIISILNRDDLNLFSEILEVEEEVIPPENRRINLIDETIRALKSLLDGTDDLNVLVKIMETLNKHKTEESKKRKELISLNISKKFSFMPQKTIESFYNRTDILRELDSFISSPKSIFVLQGMSGIGKSCILEQKFDKIPNIRVLQIRCIPGESFDRLVIDFAKELNLEQKFNNSNQIFEIIDNFSNIYIVFENAENLLNEVGEFRDDELEDFIFKLADSFLNNPKKKIFITTSRAIKFKTQLHTMSENYTIYGLKEDDAIALFTDLYRMYSSDNFEIDLPQISEKVVKYLYGHPLAIKLAAKQCSKISPEELQYDLRLITKLRNSIIKILLDKIKLKPSQEKLLQFISCFRIPIHIEAIIRFGGNEVLEDLNILVDCFLIEKNDELIDMAPVIKDYYKEKLSQAKFKDYNKFIADYYLEKYEKLKNQDKINLQYLNEAMGHYFLAGDPNKARELGFEWRYQAEQAIYAAFKKRDFETVIILSNELERANYKNYNEKIVCQKAIALAELRRWKESEQEFHKALLMTQKDIKRTAYIYQQWGNLLRRKGALKESEEKLLEGLKLDPENPYLLTSLAINKAAQGLDYEAEKLFEDALASERQNYRALKEYSIFLYERKKEYKKALNFAKEAFEIYGRSKDRELVREIESKIEILEKE